eukprot:COSAG01_NODE_402_length_17510_cov_6.871575_6_plen_46_part_00
MRPASPAFRQPAVGSDRPCMLIFSRAAPSLMSGFPGQEGSIPGLL